MKSLQENTPQWLQIITIVTPATSVIVSLLAVFISARVAKNATERNFAAQVLSTNRQNWINELRKTVYDFEANVLQAFQWKIQKHSMDDTYHKHIREANFSIFKAELFLTDDLDYNQIIPTMNAIITECNGRADGDAISGHVKTLTVNARNVFRKEWKKASTGE